MKKQYREVSFQNTSGIPISCVIHGSFNKHFDLIKKIQQIFSHTGVNVLAPKVSEVKLVLGGFALLEGEEDQDPRSIELNFYELGIAQLRNLRCFFLEPPVDHPVQKSYQSLPAPEMKSCERRIHKLMENLVVPGSVVAVGGIIEYCSPWGVREILLVKTHKWDGRYSVVGSKVRRNERLKEALLREVQEETGLRAEVDRHICTFDQINDTGYYLPGMQHIFVDNVVKVFSKRVRLNDEAQSCVWVPPSKAFDSLDVEPNARQTIQLYLSK